MTQLDGAAVKVGAGSGLSDSWSAVLSPQMLLALSADARAGHGLAVSITKALSNERGSAKVLPGEIVPNMVRKIDNMEEILSEQLSEARPGCQLPAPSLPASPAHTRPQLPAPQRAGVKRHAESHLHAPPWQPVLGAPSLLY